MLESIDFVWNRQDTKWKKYLKRLVAYNKESNRSESWIMGKLAMEVLSEK